MFRRGKNNVESGASTRSLYPMMRWAFIRWVYSILVEPGTSTRPLYPMMQESPQMRWAFIRRVYTVLAFQMFLTVAVAFVVVFGGLIPVFFAATPASFALWIVLLITPFIALWLLTYHYKSRALDYFLLSIFTVALAFVMGLLRGFTSGKVFLAVAILTTGVVVSLTLYTFWAARRGQDFGFLGPFLSGAIFVLMLFVDILIISFPFGRIAVIIFGFLTALVFSGHTVYVKDNLIKRYSYDDCIGPSVSYLDIIIVFMALLTMFRTAA